GSRADPSDPAGRARRAIHSSHQLQHHRPLIIVYISYLQTISAYPGGGGSYTVARENLGARAALLAAAALIVDYILVVAVGISAGVGALASAVPGLQPHTLSLCLWILAAVTLVNLRGVRETGT